jgi:hypothetical protein
MTGEKDQRGFGLFIGARMATIRERITKIALHLLNDHPDGVRYSDLVRRVCEVDSALKTNTVHGSVWNLDERFPEKVYKPSRGLFRLVQFSDDETQQLKPELVVTKPPAVKEQDFYAPFADWLVNDVEECTKAICLGGNRFKDKWGTPDVIGKRESKRSDILKIPTEIVSGEIKTDVSQLVTAFGQACAYCIFSHRSYLVVSRDAPQDEIARLDALCQVFGIGFILFDATNPQDPNFQEPDMFYANKYMKIIESEMFS